MTRWNLKRYFSEFTIDKYSDNGIKTENANVINEVPFTINVNNIEIATLMCSPCDLEELAYGFLITSLFINNQDEINKCIIDSTRWSAQIGIKGEVNKEILEKRLYTSGCGKGIMYANLSEISKRGKLANDFQFSAESISNNMKYIQKCSENYRLLMMPLVIWT